MTLELHIHDGPRSPNRMPNDDAFTATQETRTPADEGHGMRARSLELARELVSLLSDPRTRGAAPSVEAELSIASSLASHVVDILAGLTERR